jgi:DTW domain-containing protein YfiP
MRTRLGACHGARAWVVRALGACERRRVDGSPTPRVECPRCRRPERECYCAAIVPQRTRTKVVLLQHPRERDVPIGTARMASLCLPDAELHIGASFAGSPVLARLLSDPERPAALLYPGEGAIDLSTHPPPGPITLVVVDGTWSQAKKIVKTTPELAALPRYSFVPARPSEYQIRKEPQDDYVSTIESLVYVLGALEGEPERFTSLLAPFRAMVAAQVDHAARRTGPPRRRVRQRPRRGASAPAILRERTADLLVVAGEANAWPFGSPQREDDVGELVHWVAERPSTGERFEAVIRPVALAPTTTLHIRLAQARLAAGMSREEFVAAWRAFVRDDDVLVGWGSYAPRVLTRAGAFVPPAHLDLRHVANVLANRRVGSLEAFHATLAQRRAATFEGRGGARLAMALDVLEALAQRP